MEISNDPHKRAKTLAASGLDFQDAGHVFAGRRVDYEDRHYFGEVRWTSVGLLRDRMVVLVWTARGKVRHMSMSKANEREQEKHGRQLGS